MIIKCDIDTIALPKNFLKEQKTTITLGNFDGVHLGHQSLLKTIYLTAKKRQSISTVITFEPHPQTVLTGESPSLLTTKKEKLKLIKSMGIEIIFQLNFTSTLANMTTEQFVQLILLDRLHMEGMILGHDFSMGKDRSGTQHVLAILGKTMGFTVIHQPVFKFKEQPVSSSLIRKAIQEGAIEKANVLLGRCYSIDGTIIHGKKRGRILGFPTANLALSSNLIPSTGVYATLVTLGSNQDNSLYIPVQYQKNTFLAVTNIGINPTFGDSIPKIETHLLNFHNDLYDQHITISFLKKLREETIFSNISSLITQIKDDISQTKTIFKNMLWPQSLSLEDPIDRMDATLKT